MFRDELGQRLTDKTGFARSRNAGDSGEAADGKLDVETLKIVTPDPFKRSHALGSRGVRSLRSGSANR